MRLRNEKTDVCKNALIKLESIDKHVEINTMSQLKTLRSCII